MSAIDQCHKLGLLSEDQHDWRTIAESLAAELLEVANARGTCPDCEHRTHTGPCRTMCGIMVLAVSLGTNEADFGCSLFARKDTP